jgi:ubiquinone/menaquinone biosynthesis C-methylase UbiE
LKIYDRIHSSFIFPERVKVLSKQIAQLIPQDSVILDVGCGDGLISKLISNLRPDITMSGIDVLIRSETHINVDLFDGLNIPYKDKSMDTVLFVDVLHHSNQPEKLLSEARRVARKAVIIKDHNMEGFLSEKTLKIMDLVGNLRYNVNLPYNYMREKEWEEIFNRTGYGIDKVKNKIKLYPWFINWIFGRSLHFIAVLKPL